MTGWRALCCKRVTHATQGAYGARQYVLFQHLHQADLPPASPLSSTTCPMPAVVWSQRRRSATVPTDQWGQARCGDVEPGLRSTFLQDAIDLERLRQVFKHLCPKRLTHK